jgi:hypothetical protein
MANNVMLQRVTLAAALVAAFQLISVEAAFADNQVVLVATDDHIQMEVSDDGQLTADVTLINNGATPVSLDPSLTDGTPSGCNVEKPGEQLTEHRQATFKLSFSGCPKDQDIHIAVAVGGQTFRLTADAPKSADPNWLFLLSFLGAAAVAGLVLWRRYKTRTSPANRAKTKSMSLPGLAPTWTFKDSWAANATVITAAFTGLFGTKEVTTSLLGDDATNVLASALVSAAISIGLAGLSPMILQALRHQFAKEDLDGDKTIQAGLYVTPLGLLIAGVITPRSTGGQLAVVVFSLLSTDFLADWTIIVAGFLAAALLIWYAWKSTQQNLDTGAQPPEPEAKTPTPEQTRTMLDQAGLAGAGQPPTLVPVMINVPERRPVRPAAIL